MTFTVFPTRKPHAWRLRIRGTKDKVGWFCANDHCGQPEPIPEPIYLSKRRQILQGFLDRSPIFNTKYFRDRLEMCAQRNLESALAEIDMAIDSLPRVDAPAGTQP